MAVTDVKHRGSTAVKRPQSASGHRSKESGSGRNSLRQQKKARAREAILQAAWALISRHGYGETRMREIATQADVSYQTLYNYFPTKALMLQELLTRRQQALLTESARIARSSPESLLEGLIALCACYADAISDADRALWREVCAELLNDNTPEKHLLLLLDAEAREKIGELLAWGRQSGQLNSNVHDDLTAVVFHLCDAALLRCMLNVDMTHQDLLEALRSEIGLVVAPYLQT